MALGYKMAEFTLRSLAKQGGKTTDFLRRLDHLSYQGNEIAMAKKVFGELFHISKGQISYNDQFSPEYVLEGLKLMFVYMKQNTKVTSAPQNSSERREFYSRLAKGFAYLGNVIKEQYAIGNLDKKEVYACLETVGSGGHYCAGRWKQVLEELFMGFSDRLPAQHFGKIENDKLNEFLQDLFFQAKVIETNRVADDFVNFEYPNAFIGNRLHYIASFKRYINETLEYQLPIHMEHDSYLGLQEQEISNRAKKYLTNYNLDHAVVKRFIRLFEENIKKDDVLWNAVVDYATNLYQITSLKHEYEEPAEYLSQKVFYGYTKDIRREFLTDMLVKKKFIRQHYYFKPLEKDLRQMMKEKRWEDLEELLRDVGKQVFFYTDFVDFLNTTRQNGQPLLVIAAKNKLDRLSRILIDAGTLDLHVQDRRDNNTALHWSIQNNDEELAELLLEHGANPEIQNIEGRTALHYACQLRNEKLAYPLIEKAKNIDLQDNFGSTPLHLASQFGQTKIAKFLLAQGARVDIQDILGNTPLIWASAIGNLAIQKMLLEKNANLNYTTLEGKTALHYAIHAGFDKSVLQLLQYKPKLALMDKVGNTPLTLSAELGNIRIAKELINQGVPIEQRDSDDCTALHIAAKRGHLSLGQELLALGANPNVTDRFGESPYLAACKRGDLRFVEELIHRRANPHAMQYRKSGFDFAMHGGFLMLADGLYGLGVSPNPEARFNGETLFTDTLTMYGPDAVKLLLDIPALFKERNSQGRTPLHFCAEFGFTKIAKHLIQKGAEINSQDHNGNTPLIWFAATGNIEGLTYAIEHGAELEYQTIEERTALAYACINRHFDAAKFLLEKGADHSKVPDIQGESILLTAMKANHNEFACLWIKSKNNVNQMNASGNTHLIEAVQAKNRTMVEHLLEIGADPRIKNGQNKTPFKVAKDLGCKELMRVIKKAEKEKISATLSKSKFPLLGGLRVKSRRI